MKKAKQKPAKRELKLTHSQRTTPPRMEQSDWFKLLDEGTQQTCEALAEVAQEVTQLVSKAVSKYVELVLFVRDSQLEQDLVTKVLDSQGYNEARISEIKRVAYGPTEILDRLKTAVIGFKTAIRLARDADRDPKATLTLKLNRATSALVRIAEDVGPLDEIVNEKWRVVVTEVKRPK